MNPQQVAQPRSSANGFNRGRGEKETGTRLGNKSLRGKANYNRSSTAGLQAGNKGGVESPSRERLVYITACLIGHQVEVQVIDGSVYSGIFHATDAEKDFGIILKMARVIKAGSSRGQKNISDSVQKPSSKILIIPAKDLVQIVAKSVSVTRDGLMNELRHDQLHDIMIDSSISQSWHVDLERELEPWVPDDDNAECPELDNTFDRHWNRGWDQFEANATLFGVKSTFNEELYTTKLVRGPQMIEREREALRIAREIECEDTQDLHLAEERGIHFHEKFDLDEETKYSSVFRGVDDSGYDEDEDILDSQNSETFGDVSDSVMNRSFSEVDIQRSHLSTSNDFHPSGSMDGQSSVQDYQTNQQHAGSNYSKEDTENQTVYDQSQSSKLKELPNKESGNNELSATATAYAPPIVASKAQEKTSSSEQSEGAAATVKIHAHTVSRTRPASSASSTSEPGNTAPTSASAAAAAASAPGLSPSSSMGSFTSEKSTLNPHAKEFRFNPNAKSFVPSPTQLKASSPVSDGSFYYPANVAPVQHMHGVPVGVGTGPAFPPHQPVIFGPQGTPLQTPQTYFHPNGPHYGQQMLLGQPRQVYYMPNYPPEMPYKGREF